MTVSRAQAGRIVKLSPQRLAAWERRGLLHGSYDFGDLSRARELASQLRQGVPATRLTPGSVGVLQGQPVLADSLGLKLEDGQGVLDFRPPPPPPGAHPEAARYWLERGDAARAVELDPTLAEGWHRLGLDFLQQGDPARARDCWRRLVELRPGDARARYNLALALEDCRQLPEATEELHQALALEPRYAAAHFNLARVYEQLGRRARARWHWQAASFPPV